MTEIFATHPAEYVQAADRLLGYEIRQLLRDPYYPPRQRAVLAVDLIRAHVARTAAVVNAASYEPEIEHAEAN